ncbi:MAG: valine--tRNA ligase, partial [Deltaproteobacteria bacterium]|nr:valine--tRNA ligase [Deltaproteobacteria bacterium]
IPPPNITGGLHIGHALNITLQDVLCRFARQQGKKVLWLPGTDHAGIATQNVVERALAREGKGRHDLGREAFVDHVWQWKKEFGGHILTQIKRLGASVDWTRERFTMDEGLSRAVRRVFADLYKQGYIYRGKYIINWCIRCHTALADDEVEHGPQQGHLWHVRYHLADGSGSLVVATTRPETILGDTALCVHPEDDRYATKKKKKAYVPVIKRAVPVIADSYVDREFGTGVLKVTPAHDHNDWELGRRHKLDVIQAIDENGVMSDEAGPYRGLSKEECRKAIIQDIEATGDLALTEKIEHAVGHCYRCKSVVEPHVSIQWFVASTKLAPRARQAAPGLTKIWPESWLKTYYNWLDNIRDWCISRQIWWGHRIPAWTCRDCGELIVAEESPATCPCGSTRLDQDEDVLDTWFSSALWPFSTLGWPEKTRELTAFYPTAVLVTGFDILFFWVARMMMMGLHFMDEVPFRNVYIHALVRDVEGRKMSKSTGNVIDPIEMIDKYGCDALRFTLTAFAAMGRDIKLSEERIEGYRHFVNKLWNAARFALMNLPAAAPAPVDLAQVEGLHHQWILHRLEAVKEETEAALSGCRFNDMAQGLYKFLWNELCDWYLELVKPDLREEDARRQTALFVLWTVLRETLVLLHPVMPFVSAEIWQALPGGAGGDVALERFPPVRPGCRKAEEAGHMEFMQEVIVAVRTMRAELGIAPAKKLACILRPADAKQLALLGRNRRMMEVLARLEQLDIGQGQDIPRASAAGVVQGCEVVVPLAGAVDLASELVRLDKELAGLGEELAAVQQKLANASFVERAPAAVVQRERERCRELADAGTKLEALRRRFAEAMNA